MFSIIFSLLDEQSKRDILSNFEIKNKHLVLWIGGEGVCVVRVFVAVVAIKIGLVLMK